MRTGTQYQRGFIGGFVLALASVGVSLLTLTTVRRVRVRRTVSAETPIGIDSIAPSSIELSAQPAREGNATPRRLESEIEMNDVMVKSQRW